MPSFFQRIKISIYLDAAYQYASKGEYAKAVEKINLAENVGLPKINGEWSKESISALVLKSLSLIKLKKYDEAINILIGTQKFLLSIPNQSDEVKYMECVCAVLAGDSANKYSKNDLISEINYVRYDVVNLRNVQNYLKRRFPLRNHPNWDL